MLFTPALRPSSGKMNCSRSVCLRLLPFWQRQRVPHPSLVGLWTQRKSLLVQICRTRRFVVVLDDHSTIRYSGVSISYVFGLFVIYMYVCNSIIDDRSEHLSCSRPSGPIRASRPSCALAVAFGAATRRTKVLRSAASSWLSCGAAGPSFPEHPPARDRRPQRTFLAPDFAFIPNCVFGPRRTLRVVLPASARAAAGEPGRGVLRGRELGCRGNASSRFQRRSPVRREEACRMGTKGTGASSPWLMPAYSRTPCLA